MPVFPLSILFWYMPKMYIEDLEHVLLLLKGSTCVHESCTENCTLKNHPWLMAPPILFNTCCFIRLVTSHTCSTRCQLQFSKKELMKMLPSSWDICIWPVTMLTDIDTPNVNRNKPLMASVVMTAVRLSHAMTWVVVTLSVRLQSYNQGFVRNYLKK